MNKNSLGAVCLAVATALGAAEAGCDSNGKEAAGAAEKALTAIAGVQANFNTAMQDAIKQDFFPGGGEFSLSADYTDPTRQVLVHCVKRAKHADSAGNLTEKTECNLDTFQTSQLKYGDGGVHVAAVPLPQLTDEQTVSHEIETNGYGKVVREGAKITTDLFQHGSDVDFLDNKDGRACFSNSYRVAPELCDRFFAAAKSALAGILEAGKVAHERLDAQKKGDRIPDTGGVHLRSGSALDAGGQLNNGLPEGSIWY